MIKKIILIIVSLIALGAGVWAIFGNNDKIDEAAYQLSEVTIGDLESTISATGALNPLTTVEIGTQVSGSIDSVYVDFNDEVVAGQILAVLDTVLLKASVIDAEASYERSSAAYEEAEYNFNLNQRLFDKGLISEADLLPYKIAIKSQAASVKSAQAQVDRAYQNLDYAIIRSPIGGTIISKNVESGQTVAASLSTPTLFIVAEDLSYMEILVDVDESDIGMIKSGQNVRFEVQSYDDVIFDGVVRQVRLQPTTSSNVVTYTVVVDAVNKDNQLMPGMTATVDFIVEEKSDVLIVSNKALRYQPDEDVMAAFFEKKQQERQANRENFTGNQRPRPGGGMVPPGMPSGQKRSSGQAPKNAGKVWYLDDNEELQMSPVKTGMTDGINTEIVMSPRLTEGVKVIIGAISDDDSESGSSSNSNNRRKGGGFGRPPKF